MKKEINFKIDIENKKSKKKIDNFDEKCKLENSNPCSFAFEKSIQSNEFFKKDDLAIQIKNLNVKYPKFFSKIDKKINSNSSVNQEKPIINSKPNELFRPIGNDKINLK